MKAVTSKLMGNTSMRRVGLMAWLGVIGALMMPMLAGLAGATGGMDLSWNTVDAGGTTFSTGGTFGLGGTVGQPDAGVMSGGTFGLTGGFWGSSASAPKLVGHVTWQGPPAQPNVRQLLPITLTLCVSGTPVAYGATTDSSGFFTVTTSLPSGSYNWRVKGPKYLATAGTASLVGGGITQVEMGQQKAGDVDNAHNNLVNATDFNVMKGVFGTASSTGDLNNDGVTNATDFNLLKGNFGQAGNAVNCP